MIWTSSVLISLQLFSWELSCSTNKPDNFVTSITYIFFCEYSNLQFFVILFLPCRDSICFPVLSCWDSICVSDRSWAVQVFKIISKILSWIFVGQFKNEIESDHNLQDLWYQQLQVRICLPLSSGKEFVFCKPSKHSWNQCWSGIICNFCDTIPAMRISLTRSAWIRTLHLIWSSSRWCWSVVAHGSLLQFIEIVDMSFNSSSMFILSCLELILDFYFILFLLNSIFSLLQRNS